MAKWRIEFLCSSIFEVLRPVTWENGNASELLSQSVRILSGVFLEVNHISFTVGVLLLGALGCRPSAPRNQEVTVAAAANLTEVFQSLGPQFEAQTGIRVNFSFGSTALLARQIENSAPFDVFAAADAAHVRQLDKAGLLEPGTRTAYAKGVLALWIPPQSRSSVSRLEDLDSPDIRVIAIAKPELAPYGQAAMEALQHANILDRVRPKIVYAENIGMAKQFGTSNNADAVFTAYSLVLHAGGKVLPIDEALYRPIEQELGIMAQSHNRRAAHQFVDFLLTGKGRDALIAYGYRTPGGRRR